MASSSHGSAASGHDGGTRRDFLYVSAGAFTAIGTLASLWPFVHSMNPAADVLALSTTEVDLKPVAPGQSITATWRGKPVFIRRRTAAEIASARQIDPASLPDPATDQSRVRRPEWLILVGVCTHLGCVPLGQKTTDPRGDYGGWFCPCHGSHYDTAGRIRRGPAPANLPVPPYQFLDDTTIRIG